MIEDEDFDEPEWLKPPESRDPHNMTQKEVAVFFGVTPQAINQVEKRALAKIRKILRLRGILKDDIF